MTYTDYLEQQKVRKKPSHPESHLQRSCVTWFRLQYPNLIIFAIPNGGKRGKIEAGIMKGEGVLAGVADLLLMYAKNGYHGLFVEIKDLKGTQSPAQKIFAENALKCGYQYAVCNSLESFMETIKNYLK